VNYLSCRVPILKPVQRRVKDPFGLGTARKARMLAPEELYGSKVKALVERAQPRDVFDVSVLNGQIGRLDFKTLKRSAIFYCALELESDFRKMSFAVMLGHLDERRVKNVLRPTLARDYHLDLKQLRESTESLVRRILETDGVESEFLDAFYSGRYLPQLLFPDNESLKHRPGAAWRMRQLRVSK
jgi:Nucleotidyl transferase AbiEii toxin, Type IV TA system